MPKPPTWQQFRRGGITGTDAAALLGRGGSPYTVWADKQGKLPPTEESEAMYWGNRLEDTVAEEFSYRSATMLLRPTPGEARDLCLPGEPLEGCRILFLDDENLHPGQRYRMVLQNIERPWMRSTPDTFFVVSRKPVSIGILECKTTGQRMAKDWADGDAPYAAQIQLQWNLAVSGLKHGALACLIGGQRFVAYRTTRNEKFIEYITQEALKFHVAYCMVPGAKPPPCQGGDLEAARLLAGAEKGTTVELPVEAAEVHEHLMAIEEQAKELQTDIDGCRAQLIQWIGEHSVGVIPAVARYTYYTQEREGTEYRVLRRKLL